MAGTTPCTQWRNSISCCVRPWRPRWPYGCGHRIFVLEPNRSPMVHATASLLWATLWQERIPWACRYSGHRQISRIVCILCFIASPICFHVRGIAWHRIVVRFCFACIASHRLTLNLFSSHRIASRIASHRIAKCCHSRSHLHMRFRLIHIVGIYWTSGGNIFYTR